MCAFSYNPPPPWTVLGVTCQTLLKNLVSVWTSTLFRGRGGGGNPGIAILTTVDWRSLTNFLPKRGGGKSSVPNPFGQDCSLYADVVLFSFPSFQKHRRAPQQSKRTRTSPTTTPLRWRSINPLRFKFYHPRSTDFEEKIEGLWTG